VNCVYVVGAFARGVDNHVIELVFVCEEINREYLARLIGKAEKLVQRKISYFIMNKVEFDEYVQSMPSNEALLLWSEK
jgi:hypothetical protein